MKRILLGAVIIDALLVTYSFIVYPPTGGFKTEDVLLEFLLVVVGFLYLFATLFGTKEYDVVDRWIHRMGTIFGLAAGILLVGEIVTGSMGDTPIFGSQNPSDLRLFQEIGIILVTCTFALILAGSIYAARRTGQVTAGVRVGLWSALIASLIGFAAMTLISLFFTGDLIQSPSNIIDFSASGEPDIAAYLVRSARIAGTIVLALGLPLGVSLGALGGLAGRRLALMRR